MTIEILKYEIAQKGKVIGYVDIHLTKWGLIIRKIAHLQNGDRRWFNFPAFSKQVDEKLKYYPYVQFSTESTANQLFEKLSSLVQEYCELHSITRPDAASIDEEIPF